MSASTPKNPASSPTTGGDQQEVIYVKLPPPGTMHASRRPTDAPNPLIRYGGALFAFALCCTLPLASGLIMVLLMIQPGKPVHGFLWLWIPMFVFVESIAVLVAYGIWRETSGWSRGADFQR